MSVRIQFDKPIARHYTNLDFVTGRVILILPQEATISAITVKLEGESRSRLAGPKQPYNDRSDKKRTELEIHKLLYRVATVFPTPELQQHATSSSNFTLAAGQYEYPFHFKFPFNNACSRDNSIGRDLRVGAMRVEFAPDTNQHVKKALPPTLSGFPGEADIKYYVKATVVRPKFYQENLRFQMDVKFLPIEPPRPPDRREETFARRKQQFARSFVLPQKKSFFRKSPPESLASEEPPSFQVDARLPNPSIVTCNEPLPLRILVQKLSESSATVYLGMLQIELIGYTHVRAHDLTRTESSSWVLMSQSNMNIPLGNAADPAFKEWKVPSRLWDTIPLPNTVAPSFDTCNISRSYDVEVRVGLAHGEVGAIRPELIVLPLRLPVKIYSGIAPPPALLRAISTNHQPTHTNGAAHANETLQAPHTLQTENVPLPSPYHPPTPMTPVTPTTPSYMQPPPQHGSYGPMPTPVLDEAPPSYEDAMAEDIAPVDGPRRDYSTPMAPDRRETAFGDDSKGVNRRPSERLFASNDIHSSSRAPSLGRSAPAASTFPILEEEDDSKGVNRKPSERLFASNDIDGFSRASSFGHSTTPVGSTYPILEEFPFDGTGQVLPDDDVDILAEQSDAKS